MTLGVAVNFLSPKNVLDQIGLVVGQSVADFGSGSGHFTLEAARRVGDDGKVYAIDVLDSALETIESSAKVEGLKNIIYVRENLENEQGSEIPAGTVDLVIAKDIFFQSKKKENILKEAFRVLKSNGLLLVVEWDEKQHTIGPDTSSRIPEKELRSMVEKGGFHIEKKPSAGDYHYAFLGKKL